MKSLILAIAALGIVYLATAFTELHINFHLWSSEARFGFVYFGFAAIIAIVIVAKLIED